MRTAISSKSVTLTTPAVVDFVCGMRVDGLSDVLSMGVDGKELFFCSDHCKNRFTKDPERFSKTPLLELRGVEKLFNMGGARTAALSGLDLRVWEGDFVSIIGASGSGKSTALNMIGLLDVPTFGEVFLRGKNVASLSDEERAGFRSKTFGFIFQQYNLIPWLTAYENVALPAIFSKTAVSRDTVIKRFKEIGLGDRMVHRPTELSGGEQQRTALLRSLINNPDIILGDEPTGNLDSATGNKILNILINLNKKEGKTLVIVTHDADIAERADQVIVMKDGKLVRDHTVHKKIYTE